MLCRHLCVHFLISCCNLLQDAGQEEYGGPKPFSEPQTRIMKALAAAAQPRAFVNLHSGEYAMYVPWDSQATQAAGLPVSAPS